jgi:hypothetical protein
MENQNDVYSVDRDGQNNEPNPTPPTDDDRVDWQNDADTALRKQWELYKTKEVTDLENSDMIHMHRRQATLVSSQKLLGRKAKSLNSLWRKSLTLAVTRTYNRLLRTVDGRSCQGRRISLTNLVNSRFCLRS